MVDARKDIVFRDENYREKFRIKDGDSIKITVAYDGEVHIRKCRFLDETHMNVGSTCFHMDEFMERQRRAGNSYEPVMNGEPTLDILLVEPGQTPRDVSIPIHMAALSALIGGSVVVSPLNDHAAMVKGNAANDAMGKDVVFAICGLNGDMLTSLHPYWAQKYRRDYAPPSQQHDTKMNKGDAR